MSKAYVLIHCDMGYVEPVTEQLKLLKNVTEVSGVFGAYDVVVVISAQSSDDLEDVVAKIRRFDRIRSTLTLPIVEGQGEL